MAFINAFVDPTLIYLPLKSYFLPIKVTQESKFYGLPGWLLASDQIKPFLSFKIVNEIAAWVLVILLILLFLKNLELKEWFFTKEMPLPKMGFKEFVKSLPKKIHNFFETFREFQKNKLHPHPLKTKFFPKNIFEIDYSQITFLSVFITLIAVFLFPNDSSDFFGYIARGAQQVVFGQNPFSELVMKIPGWQHKPLLGNFLWSQNPSPYGPLFMLICRGIVALAFGNLWVSMFLFKFFSAFMFFLLVFLTYKMLHDQEFTKKIFLSKFSIATEQKIKKLIYSLIALNPFLILECIWNAHNDVYMAFFIIFSLYMLLKHKFNLSLIALILATLIKYFSIVLLPFYMVYYFKVCNRDTLKTELPIFSYLKKFPYFGLVFSLSLSYYLFNFYELGKFKFKQIFGNMTLAHKSFYGSLNTVYKYFLHQDLPTLIKQIFFLGFFIFVSVLLWKSIKTFKDLDFFEYSFWTLFVLILVVSPKFHSWYLCSLLPLMVFVRPRLALIMTCTHLCSLTFLDQANILNFLLMTLIPFILYQRTLRHLDTVKI